MAIALAEKHGWGNSSRREFLEAVKLAHQNKEITDKLAFDLTMRAMKVGQGEQSPYMASFVRLFVNRQYAQKCVIIFSYFYHLTKRKWACQVVILHKNKKYFCAICILTKGEICDMIGRRVIHRWSAVLPVNRQYRQIFAQLFVHLATWRFPALTR